jgi:ATP-dependent exoDNAse (exonuclease V) beta subunit
MKRGEAIHHLIETLTKTSADRWDSVMARFKNMDTIALSDADFKNVYDMTQHPDFAPLFKSQRAWSEIEILHDGKWLRIDRLIETNDAFWIVDFKTGTQRKVKAYQEQLLGYKTAISSMVGDKAVRLFLFWTDALVLEEVA